MARGKIDNTTLDWTINGSKPNGMVEYDIKKTPSQIHDKSEIEAELKLIKAEIQRDEEEANKLMTKD